MTCFSTPYFIPPQLTDGGYLDVRAAAIMVGTQVPCPTCRLVHNIMHIQTRVNDPVVARCLLLRTK